jgi:type IV secretion system protein VirB11
MSFAAPSSTGGADGASLWQSLPIFFRQVAQPIRFLLEDPAVIEIMCNCPGEVWVERTDQARMVRHAVASLDERAIRGLAQMIAGSTQQSVNEETPLLSAAMPHGERFQAVLAPVAAAGGAFAIRKQVIRDMSLDDYVALGGFDSVRVSGPANVVGDASDLDRELIERLADPSQPPQGATGFDSPSKNRVTLLISGGTSSGKTTFFNAF